MKNFLYADTSETIEVSLLLALVIAISCEHC